MAGAGYRVDSGCDGNQIVCMKKMSIVQVCCFLAVILPVCGHAALENLQAVYEREMANIETTFRYERLALPQQHVTVLRRMEAYFQGEGDLAALLAIQEARQQFVLDPTPSGLVAVQSPDALVRLQQNYREAFAAAARLRQERITGLEGQYRAALGRLQRELTRQGQIEEARRVFDVISSLQPPAGAPEVSGVAGIDIDLGQDTSPGITVRTRTSDASRPDRTARLEDHSREGASTSFDDALDRLFD